MTTRRLHPVRTAVLVAIALAAGACAAPAAKTADADLARERALRKTIIGGTAGRPIMGQFLLRKKDAARVDAAFSRSSRAAFDLAERLAVKKWVYEDRWCDDAVRQIVFLGTPAKTALEATADALKAKYFEKILERHQLMYLERTPEACERALRRMHEAKLLAHKNGLVHKHFGY